jgi:hypothetical protein
MIPICSSNQIRFYCDRALRKCNQNRCINTKTTPNLTLKHSLAVHPFSYTFISFLSANVVLLSVNVTLKSILIRIAKYLYRARDTRVFRPSKIALNRKQTLPKTQIQANTTGGHGYKTCASLLTPHCAVFYYLNYRILGGIEIHVFSTKMEDRKTEVNLSKQAKCNR